LAALLAKHPEVQYINVEDSRGKPLGRSFRVKLWPTLVFLRDGQVVKLAVRPGLAEIREGLQAITGGAE
jgi:thioredoxin 1